MKMIVVGCGHLGSGLAVNLAAEGNQVTVLSKEEKQFIALGEDFQGETISGVEFDKDILEQAGIERCDSLIACTESDETNALVARIARIYYKVPRVIARLYDQRKVDIYNSLDIQVIATTRWGIARAKELLTFSHLDSVFSFGNTPVEVVRIEAPILVVGKSLHSVFPMNEVRIIALTRGNKTFIPDHKLLLQKHDVVYLAVMADAVGKLQQALGM